MSDPGEAPSAASRVLSAVMLLFGIILVLPGLCAGYFAVIVIFSPGNPYLSGLGPLWVICFAIAAAGIALIVWGLRRLQRTSSMGIMRDR
jgi:FtsH-binding integral membrane protein